MCCRKRAYHTYLSSGIEDDDYSAQSPVTKHVIFTLTRWRPWNVLHIFKLPFAGHLSDPSGGRAEFFTPLTRQALSCQGADGHPRRTCGWDKCFFPSLSSGCV